MAIESRQVNIAKEIDDVGALVVALVEDIKAGKPIAEIATENLAELMNAVQGIDAVDDEIAANRKAALATIGYRSGELADALLKKKSDPPAPDNGNNPVV